MRSECRGLQFQALSFGLCVEGSREPLTAVERSLAELTDIFE